MNFEINCKLEGILEQETEVGSPINHFLHKMSGSIVINKDIILLKGRYTLEDS
jgi:hypothetical protein